MIKIEVKSTAVTLKTGVSARTGKPYNIREQEAYAHLYDRTGHLAPYPVRIVLSLEEDQPPYAAGDYTLDPRCVYPDRFGSLTLGRTRLESAKAAVVRQAA